jgi:hypothetical protein
MRACPYCSEPLTLIQRLWGDGVFCSREHKRLYQEEFTRLALRSLTRSTAREREAKPKETPLAPAREKGTAAPPAMQGFLTLTEPVADAGNGKHVATAEPESMLWSSQPGVSLPGLPQIPGAGLPKTPSKRLEVSAWAPGAGAPLQSQEERASLAPALPVYERVLSKAVPGLAGCMPVGVYETVPEPPMGTPAVAGWKAGPLKLWMPQTTLLGALPLPETPAEETEPAMVGLLPVGLGAIARGKTTTAEAEWSWCAASSGIAIRQPARVPGWKNRGLGRVDALPVASRETPWPAAGRAPLSGADLTVTVSKIDPAWLLTRFAPGGGPAPEIPGLEVRQRAAGAAMKWGGRLRTPLQIEWLGAHLKLVDWSNAVEDQEAILAKGSEDVIDVTVRLARPQLVRDVAAIEPLGNRLWGLYIPRVPEHTLRPRMYAGPPPAYGL